MEARTSQDRPGESDGSHRHVQAGNTGQAAAETGLAGITEHAKVVARDAARSGKTAAAAELGSIAEEVRRSAEGWDAERHGWVRDGLTNAADSLQRFSTSLRDRDVADVFQDIEALARRNPAVFIGVCALAGFVATRFFKSGPRGG